MYCYIFKVDRIAGSETVSPKVTMLELHSNYTMGGSRTIENGVLPTPHIFHETVEITYGFNEWSEVGFYFFNALGYDNRSNYVGSHIRPRVGVPEQWHWPVGVSLSVEGGFQKLQYSEDDWSMEIRPIVYKAFGKCYLSFIPTFDKALHGLNKAKGYIFSTNLKGSYDGSKVWVLRLEYYGAVGGLFKFLPYEQQQELFAAADVNFP